MLVPPPNTGNLRLLVGPLRSGKTARLVTRYADELSRARASGQIPRLLWLAPHYLLVDQVRQQLLQRVGATLAPGIQTVARFFEANVSTRADAPLIFPRAATRQLLRQAIDEAKINGELALLARAAERTGLVDAVEGMIGECKLRGVTAARFAEVAQGPSGSTRDVELATIYSRYQQALGRCGAADRFDVAPLGIELLANEPAEENTIWDLIILDGFARFSHHERQLVNLLATRTRELCISLPIESLPSDSLPSDSSSDETPPLEGPPEGAWNDRLDELDVAARQTLTWFQRHYPHAQLEPVLAPKANRAPASLEYLRKNLFRHPAQRLLPSEAAQASAERIQIVAASSAQDELEQVAWRIKSLLVEQGESPEAIVVATPTLPRQRQRLVEVFDRFGLPYVISHTPLVGEAADFRALQAVLTLQAEEWSFRQLVQVLGNNLFTGFDQPATTTCRWSSPRGATEWVVRELQVAQGGGTLLEQVERMAQLDRPLPEDRRARARVARVALELLAPLVAACDALPAAAPPSGWISASEQLARQLGLHLDQAPHSAWQQVRAAAAWTERALQQQPAAKLSWDLTTWLALLRDWSQWLPLPTSRLAEGCLRVLSTSAAEYTTPQHLFLIGMSEKAFTVAGASGMYSEERYDQLATASQGEPHPLANPSCPRAMQLFFNLVSRPSDSLTLSYPALDNAGQAMPPSPWLEECGRVFGPPLSEALAATPEIAVLPRAGRPPGSLAQWRLRGVADALAKDQTATRSPTVGDPPSPARSSGQYSLLASYGAHPATRRSAEAVTAALVMLHHRTRGDSFGSFEGIFANAAAQQTLGRHFGPEHHWSTSQFETYAHCPYKFFLSKIARIEPLGDLTLETDYRRRGLLLHRALYQLHQQLRQQLVETKLPSDCSAEQFAEVFRHAVSTALSETTNLGLDGVLNELLADQIRDWREAYWEQHQQYDATSREWEQPLQPTHFELRFGPSRRDEADEAEDAHSTDEPTLIDLGSEQLRLVGRIDRIDVGRVAGQRVFQVIDYKTSQQFNISPEEVADGRKLQPALYAVAAAQVLAQDGEAPPLPLRSGYWVVQQKGFSEKTSLAFHEVTAGAVVATSEWQQLDPTLQDRLQQIVAGIRAGQFPMQNTDPQCTSQCDYAHICRVHQARSLQKVWPPPDEQRGEDRPCGEDDVLDGTVAASRQQGAQ